MRLWMQSYAHSTMFSPSAALSVAAHVVFLGAAVYGSGPRSQQANDELVEERVYYLPPPDRVKSSITTEQLHYIDVGGGRPAPGKASPNGTRAAGAPNSQSSATPGGSAGADLAEHPAQLPVPSEDSVYSVLSLDETAVRVEGSAAPIYPAELIEQHIEGSVSTRYVIDSTGRADVSTLQVLAPANALFVQAVRDAMPGMRFIPATVQGHRVRQLVEQRFDFRIIAPPPSAPAEHTRAHPLP